MDSRLGSVIKTHVRDNVAVEREAPTYDIKHLTWALSTKETPDGKKIYGSYGTGEKPKDAQLAMTLKAMAPFQLITLLVRAKSKAISELTPFNLLSYFSDSGINYKVAPIENVDVPDTCLTFEKNGHLYKLDKVVGTNYYNPHTCSYVGTLEDGQYVKQPAVPAFKFGRTLVPVSATLIKHLYMVVSTCELKNRVFRNAVTPENETKMFDIVPGYEPSTSLRMATLMNDFFKDRVDQLGNGQTTLRGDVLAHYLYVIIEKEATEVKVAFISVITDLLSSIEPNCNDEDFEEDEEMPESIAIPFPQDKVQLVLQAGYPSEGTYRYVAYPAKMQAPLSVCGLDLRKVQEGDEKLIVAARRHMEMSRSIRGSDDKKIGWLSQGCYWRTNMTDQYYKATRLRTDFAFLIQMLTNLRQVIKIVAIRGPTIPIAADFIRFLSQVPDVLFAVQSSDSNCLDWFSDISRRVEIGVDIERAIAKFSHVVDPTRYIREHVLVVDLTTVALKPYLVSSESALQGVVEANGTEIQSYVKTVESYAYSVGYIPIVRYFTSRRAIILESCTPHTCMAVYVKRGGNLGVYDFEQQGSTYEAQIQLALTQLGIRSTWQQLLATYSENDMVLTYRRYLFYSIYANFAKNVYHLTDITPGEIIREKVNNQYVEPAWFYCSMQCVDKFKLGKNHVTYEEVSIRIKTYKTLSLTERLDVRKIIANNPMILASVPDDVKQEILKPEEGDGVLHEREEQLAPVEQGVRAGPTKVKGRPKVSVDF